MKGSFFRRLAAPHLAGIAALLVAVAGAPLGFAQTHVANPFVDGSGAPVRQYLNPDYTAEVQAAIAQTSDPTTIGKMKTVETYPTAVWMDHIGAIAGGGGRLSLQGHLDAAVAQAGAGNPVVVTLVIYDLPQRDCAARASNGELQIAPTGVPPQGNLTGIQAYKTLYIDPIYTALTSKPAYANIRFVLVIEPDSLPNLVTNAGLNGNSTNLPNCQAALAGTAGGTYPSDGVYVQGITYALNRFAAMPNAYQYLDIGHSAWLGWPNNSAGAVTLFSQVVKGTTNGFNSVMGFIDDTANYTPLQEPFLTATETVGGQGAAVDSVTFYSFNPTIDEVGYVNLLQGLFRTNGWPLASTNFITDTSRSGWGGAARPKGPGTSTDLTTFVNQTKIDQRNARGQWCNQEGAGMGIPPTANPFGYPEQAFVWIKPPGESDGTYPKSALSVNMEGDPNCDPTETNPLAQNTLIGSIPNSPPAGQFFYTEFLQNIVNAYPVIPSSSSAGFTLTGSNASVMQGASVSVPITATPFNGFNAAVALTVSGLPADVSFSFTPATIPGSAGGGGSTLKLTASATAVVPAQPYQLTITGSPVGDPAVAPVTLSITLTIVGKPDFSMVTAAPGSVTINSANQNPKINIAVTPLYGFNGNVSFQSSGPACVSVNLAPNSINFNNTTAASVLTANFTAQTNCAGGLVTITGTSGSGTSLITHTATVNVIVGTATPDFSISASTPVAASSTAVGIGTVTVTPINGFTGTVAVTVPGTLPTGVGAQCTPVTITGTAAVTGTCTFTVASTGVGSSSTTVIINGTSGSLSHNASPIVLTVTGTGTLSITCPTPGGPVLVRGGASVACTVTVPTGGTSAALAMGTALPAGVSVKFSAVSAQGTATATFTALGTATLVTAQPETLDAIIGTLALATNFTLTVNPSAPAADFSIAATNASVTVPGQGTSTITVTPLNGFTGVVTLTVPTTLPTGVTANCTSVTITGTAAAAGTCTFIAAGTVASSSTTQVTVTGASGALSHNATLTLTVTVGSNGTVTVTPVVNSNSPYYNDEGIKIANTANITALSVTITVQNTGGITYNGQYNTVGGSIAQSHTSGASAITYQYTLSPGQTLGTGSNWLFDAQMGGSGTAHPTTGDTYSVTYTTSAGTATQTGHF